MIMCDAEHAPAIDKAVFPGLQGGPHNSTTAAHRGRRAAKPRTPAFKKYAHAIVANAKAHRRGAAARSGFTLVTGGTDNHLMLVDLTPQERAGQGRRARRSIAPASSCNYNSVPVRPAQAVRSVRHPPRHAGDHAAAAWARPR